MQILWRVEALRCLEIGRSGVRTSYIKQDGCALPFRKLTHWIGKNAGGVHSSSNSISSKVHLHTHINMCCRGDKVARVDYALSSLDVQHWSSAKWEDVRLLQSELRWGEFPGSESNRAEQKEDPLHPFSKKSANCTESSESVTPGSFLLPSSAL